uniref:Myosin phosphatase Rho interacting protein n=1 Tax=Gasterosteus aculeatus aculeatus TaxID=481459 RepID=A0AAQ4P678_GASAC
MSAAKENPCRKFQANFFNKSKCQNCFKPRELHLLTDQDLTQAKPIYGGWLCLAPEGTDFENPTQRSRKWQRRFFVLYEHGCLRFALDESPSTLPQGTVNMNLCTDVIDSEPKTGQKNSLCIITPDQEYFIRGENKEIINGWSEQLVVYPQTNKQNQKKKRKVEPTTSQEPGPAKVAVTGSGIPEAEKVPNSSSLIWQEELNQREAEGAPVWAPDLPPGSPLPPAGKEEYHLYMFYIYIGPLCHVASSSAVSLNNATRSGVIEKLEALELENPEKMEVEELSRRGGRQGRSEHRGFHREVTRSACVHYPHLYPTNKSHYVVNTCVISPDLLNFKKGWMVRLDAHGQWKKYWFVLTDHSLRYYRDSIAEEASDLDGEIDLSTCYSVTEYQAQRNYGFQIHTREGVHTLSAMTAGIRRNWIQAVMKNVRPSAAPDVDSALRYKAGWASARLTAPRPFFCTEYALPAGRESTPAVAKSRARERRREGRSKTFDWAQFRPIAQALAQQRAEEAGGLRADLDHLERSVRREDRWRRRGRKDCEGGDAAQQSASPVGGKQRVEEEIEQHWQQLEKTPIREERRVPLHSRDTAELQQLLENHKQGATCERGFTAMEVSHQKVIDELQRKHQRELENLHEEKERLLAEETAATIAAIEAMKNAHRAELEKELDKARKANNNTENADIEEIRRQHEEELCSFQREIEVLSDQYSQKCLENAHLAQALEAERQALRQCQRENQELNAHNQELNNRLAAEITKMRSMASEDGGGDTHTTIQGKELYELEVMLRVKESEVQYLKQEINSLKEELQAAQRDKKYATDKYKDIYTELSIVKAKAERDLGRLRDQLQAAHEALGEASLEEVERGGYDIMKSKSNPDILKMAAAAAKRSERTMRSKVGLF